MRQLLKHSSAQVLAKQAKRSDASKFKYLVNTDTFCNNLHDELHPLLQEGLLDNNFKYLTQLQREAVDAGILKGNHILLRGGNGTGKTLAYLLPILNQLYNFQTNSHQQHLK